MTRRERRAVGIGIGVVGLVALLRLTVTGIGAVERRQELLGETRSTAVRAGQVLAGVGAVETRGREVALRRTAAGSLLLEGDAPPTGVANLGDLIASWAALHGVTVESTRPGPDSAYAGVVRLSLRVTARGTEEGIVGLVEKIETAPRLLTLRELRLGDAQDGIVRLTFVVHGWIEGQPDAW